MANIYTETVVVTFSRLIKDDPKKKSSDISIVNDDIVSALEQVAEELVGSGIIVEVDRT
jgi:hypothetical protein